MFALRTIQIIFWKDSDKLQCQDEIMRQHTSFPPQKKTF